jgi:hypothetical protein
VDLNICVYPRSLAPTARTTAYQPSILSPVACMMFRVRLFHPVSVVILEPSAINSSCLPPFAQLTPRLPRLPLLKCRAWLLCHASIMSQDAFWRGESDVIQLPACYPGFDRNLREASEVWTLLEEKKAGVHFLKPCIACFSCVVSQAPKSALAGFTQKWCHTRMPKANTRLASWLPRAKCNRRSPQLSSSRTWFSLAGGRS